VIQDGAAGGVAPEDDGIAIERQDTPPAAIDLRVEDRQMRHASPRPESLRRPVPAPERKTPTRAGEGPGPRPLYRTVTTS
jgi:hypothetical protein